MDQSKKPVPPLPIPVHRPFAFRVKGFRSDGMDRHGVWEIVGCDGLGTDREILKIRRIATAREDCPLGQVFEVRSGVIRENAERVSWDTFLPSEQQGL